MIVVAHKGASSPDALELLVRAGATAVELDVHDGPGGPRVTHFTPVWALPGWIERDYLRFRPAGARSTDPLLHDVLDWLPPIDVMLDLKEKLPARRSRLNAALTDDLRGSERISISTSNPHDITHFGEAGFRTWRTLATGWRVRRYLESPSGVAEGLSVNHEALTRDVVLRLTEGCRATVLAWTVNDRDRALELRDWGVHGITTDSSTVMRALQLP